LASIQELNVAGLHINLAKAREELSGVASEALIHVPSLPYGEYVYQLLRADLMGQEEDGKVVTWRTQVTPQVVENWREHLPEGVSIASPLVWHEIEFQVHGSFLRSLTSSPGRRSGWIVPMHAMMHREISRA
jgi:hypothetical protein